MTDRELASKARRVTGLSMRKFAVRLGMNVSTISRLESGAMPVSPMIRVTLRLIIEHPRIAKKLLP